MIYTRCTDEMYKSAWCSALRSVPGLEGPAFVFVFVYVFVFIFVFVFVFVEQGPVRSVAGLEVSSFTLIKLGSVGLHRGSNSVL